MHIIMAGDHYTVELLAGIEKELNKRGITYANVGAKSTGQKVSLQEIIPAVTTKIRSGDADFGILSCGTGVGVEIGANRYKGIRASLCRDSIQAKNARIYDNANVLCLGSWYKDDFLAILDAWLQAEFDGDEKRTQMLKAFDAAE